MRSAKQQLTMTLAAGALFGLACTASAQWVEFTNETNDRLIVSGSLGATDNQEKDYSWGDLNNDGWIDLVVMRKQPFTSPGRRVNVLLINEGGELVDRTTQYASDSDVAGDEGFNTPTNDRDSQVVDLDNDGWKDVVTATTLSDGQPKHISHPRVYINKGDNAQGDWLGLRYEDARIPQLAGIAPNGFPHAPRFCSVSAGDVTGDGFADLYFGDYDSGGGQTLDFNNRLLINNGQGFFSDQTQQRFPSSTYWNAAFGAASVIADMNGDGVNEIVKQTSLNPPQHIAVKYNNPDNEGFFNAYETLNPVGAPYFVSAGDLNNNGRLDLIVTDDGTDRYYLNTGNNSQGHASFVSFLLPEQPVGFGSNSIPADLNNNGWLDIIIADVDVDISGCSRTTNIYRNNQNAPNVTFTRDLANIPSSMLQGVFDVAVFDITSNGWLDLVVGRCSGTQVWINQPSFGIEFSYPQGLPTSVEAGEETSFEVELSAFGFGLEDGASAIAVSVNGSAYTEYPLTPTANPDIYIATLPATECGAFLNYYLIGELANGAQFTDPANAPKGAFSAASAADVNVVISDDIDGPVTDWTIENDPSLTAGAWEQAFPLGVICCSGQLASPDGDASDSGNGQAFVTQNCSAGQPAGGCNVNHGPTHLISPTIDVAGSNAQISVDRWVFCSDQGDPVRADFLETYVSNDGGKTWVLVNENGGTGGEWDTLTFFVADFVEPTANVRVRFSIMDELNSSITNAAIDNFQVDEFVCDSPCPADITGDSVVDVFDMLIVLGDWGACPGCDSDLNGDDMVNVFDMLEVLGAWGACE